MVSTFTENTMLTETITIGPSMGIEIRDSIHRTPVTEGLNVFARLLEEPGATHTGIQTGPGIYVFHSIPNPSIYGPFGGYSEIEASPPIPPTYRISVIDYLGRFLDHVFCISISYDGYKLLMQEVYFDLTISSPPLSTLPTKFPPRVCLFSAQTRQVPTGLASVRTCLKDEVSGEAAAFAVLEIQLPDGQRYFGIADNRGCVIVIFPFPEFEPTLNASPPGTSRVPLYERSWNVIIRVRYEAISPSADYVENVPEFRKILNQQYAAILNVTGQSPPAHVYDTTRTETLLYGQDLILRTDNLENSKLSYIWIRTNP